MTEQKTLLVIFDRPKEADLGFDKKDFEREEVDVLSFVENVESWLDNSLNLSEFNMLDINNFLRNPESINREAGSFISEWSKSFEIEGESIREYLTYEGPAF